MTAQTRFLNPETLFQPPGYTQVVEATGPARIVYIAGQLGIDKDGRLPSDFRSQALQTFENLRAALEAVGGKLEHIVKLNNYLIDNAHLPVLRDVRAGILKGNPPPASTTLQVAGFARVGALLEIEAVAVLPPLAKAKAKPTKAGGARSTAKKVAAKPAKKAPPRKGR